VFVSVEHMIPKADASSRGYENDFPFIGRKNRKNPKNYDVPAVVNAQKHYLSLKRDNFRFAQKWYA
jgi:hypothetical protein